MCTVIVAILLVILGSIIVINVINNSKKKINYTKEDLLLYEYIDTKKTSFTGTVSYENDKITGISSKEFKVYNNSIIYSEETDNVIIPKESIIVFYYQENLSYKLDKFSEVQNNVVVSEGKKIPSSNYIIFDGEDMYFIPNESVLTINNEKIELSKNSYIIANQETFIYYDYLNDKLVKKDNIKSASLTIENAHLDLLKDVTVYNKKVTLLENNLNILNIYKEN
jgi:hypothetical protein